jgi:hypothetical protein
VLLNIFVIGYLRIDISSNIGLVWFIVLNATFNNISVLSLKYNVCHCRVVYQTTLANSVVVKHMCYWLNIDERKFRYNARKCVPVLFSEQLLPKSVVVNHIYYWLNMDARKSNIMNVNVVPV